jgi:hypothetical protein
LSGEKTNCALNISNNNNNNNDDKIINLSDMVGKELKNNTSLSDLVKSNDDDDDDDDADDDDDMQEVKGRSHSLTDTMESCLIMLYYEDSYVADNVITTTMKISQM